MFVQSGIGDAQLMYSICRVLGLVVPSVPCSNTESQASTPHGQQLASYILMHDGSRNETLRSFITSCSLFLTANWKKGLYAALAGAST